MKKYFLGIDNGGTVAKAALFDEKGMEVGVASETIPFTSAGGGWAERDMHSMWEANCRIIKKVLRDSVIAPQKIAGIGCTGHGKGLYLWGKNDTPVYPGIVSTDTRAWEYPLRWQKDGTAARVYVKTFQKILACQPVSLLAWFRDHNPDILSRVRWIFEAKDFVRYMLTGEAAAEITDYSGSGLMNIRDGCFDIGLLKEYGIAECMGALPPLVKSAELAGRISKKAAMATGLVEGTPVAGGMFDIDACAVASGVIDPENICVVAGTWSINEYVSRFPVTDGSVMMNSLFCLPEYFLIEESSPTSAGNYEWFIHFFLEKEKAEATASGLSVFEVADRMAAQIAPEECDLLFLPFLFGSNYNPEARAGFLGFSAAHTRAHMIRAVLEGIAFSHKTHLEKLVTSRRNLMQREAPPQGIPPNPEPEINEKRTVVRLTGGAAKSRLWVQIFADVFQMPIETVISSEPGALGAAIAAAVACGEYRDLREAAGYMVHLADRFDPDTGKSDIYEHKYSLYRDMTGSLDQTWSGFKR